MSSLLFVYFKVLSQMRNIIRVEVGAAPSKKL
jgi:hypothetical protein